MFPLLLFATEDSAARGTPRFGTLKSDAARQSQYLELKAGDIFRFPDLLRKRKGSTKFLHAIFHVPDNRRSRCLWRSRHIALAIELLDGKGGGGAELHRSSRKR